MLLKFIKPVLICFLSILISVGLSAQNKNPFKTIGKKGKIVTLTNGRYEELFDQDSVQQIGSVLVNIKQMKIVKVIKDEREAERLLDNTVTSRFLSVDPITRSYPMLTPYQYASNRPIDGTDLDGKEWKKVVTYDVQTGVTNIQFQVKIKILNCSQYTGSVTAIGDEFVKSIETAFRDVYDSKRKIKYSAVADYEVINTDFGPKDYGVELFDAKQTKAGAAFFGGMTFDFENTQQNIVFAAATVQTEGSEEYRQRKPSNVGSTAAHEVIHTGNVVHPMDAQNTAEDVDLTPSTFLGANNKIKKTFVPSPGADKGLILSNIMIYTVTGFNGSTVGKIIKDPNKLNKVSPDQAYIIQQQISADLNKQNVKPSTNGNSQ